jgi:tetratricopeptide (TPR) repeat protein
MRGNALRELGDLDAGRMLAERVATLARELDDPENLVIADVALVDNWLERGEPGPTADLAREALRAAERVGSIFASSMAYCSLGLVKAAMGSWPEARDAHEQSVRLLRQSRFGLPDEPFRLAALAQALAHCGELPRARAVVQEALALAESRRVRLAIILAYRVHAEVLAFERAPGSLAAAEASLEAALAIAREIGGRTSEAYVLVDLARVAWDSNDPGRCEAHLRAALGELRQIGAIGHTARIEETLSALAHRG